MPAFTLLQNPATYHPCPTENMLVDVEYREFWLTHFEHHFDVIIKQAVETYGREALPRALAAKEDLTRELHALCQTPDLLGELDLIVLNLIRQEKLFRHEIPDAFLAAKTRENAATLKVYPAVTAGLDSHADERERLLLLVEGLFAGNIYDLGAGATAERFADTSPDFVEIRNSLSDKRPWLFDDFDALADRLLNGPRHNKCVFFLDNAGSDTVLGVVPFARWLASRGTRVCLAANDLPTLNDMTYTELIPLLADLAELDPVLARQLADGALAPLNSGGVVPLIDLRKVSPQCNAEAADADLVVLEGMGRALESNFDARFNVDAVKVCMIKEKIVAARHGGKLYDCVLRFDAK